MTKSNITVFSFFITVVALGFSQVERAPKKAVAVKDLVIIAEKPMLLLTDNTGGGVHHNTPSHVAHHNTPSHVGHHNTPSHVAHHNTPSHVTHSRQRAFRLSLFHNKHILPKPAQLN